jgi:hypothetical protein
MNVFNRVSFAVRSGRGATYIQQTPWRQLQTQWEYVWFQDDAHGCVSDIITLPGKHTRKWGRARLQMISPQASCETRTKISTNEDVNKILCDYEGT